MKLFEMFLECFVKGEFGALSSIDLLKGIGTASFIVDPLMLPSEGYLFSLVLT
jgi:hypothetical protein